MDTGCTLFDGAWLAAVAEAPRAEAGGRLDDVERRADEALVRLIGEVESLASAPASLDGRIAALLALETDHLPKAAAGADLAVERFTLDVGFKRRDLMPRLPPLAERVRSLHRAALTLCRDRRWALMAERALADPGGPSSPIHGTTVRYVKSDRFDARAARSLPPDDRVRADRALKRLGEDATPPELDLRPMDGRDGVLEGALWTMKAGGVNRFILRLARNGGGDCFFVEDVGPLADYGGWAARR